MRTRRQDQEQESRNFNYLAYPTIGPPPLLAVRRYGLAEAKAMQKRWDRWRREHGERWDAGEDVPEPPDWERWAD